LTEEESLERKGGMGKCPHCGGEVNFGREMGRMRSERKARASRMNGRVEKVRKGKERVFGTWEVGEGPVTITMGYAEYMGRMPESWGVVDVGEDRFIYDGEKVCRRVFKRGRDF
jgi:hypothetical protein